MDRLESQRGFTGFRTGAVAVDSTRGQVVKPRSRIPAQYGPRTKKTAFGLRNSHGSSASNQSCSTPPSRCPTPSPTITRHVIGCSFAITRQGRLPGTLVRWTSYGTAAGYRARRARVRYQSADTVQAGHRMSMPGLHLARGVPIDQAAVSTRPEVGTPVPAVTTILLRPST